MKAERRDRASHCECFDRPDTQAFLYAGLRALGSHSAVVLDPKEASCSFQLDACFTRKGKRQTKHEEKWDYAIVTNADLGVGIEVHPATPGEVSAMIGKKKWAESKLCELCLKLPVTRWLWVLPEGSRFAPAPLEPKRRLLNAAGITGPFRRVRLVEVAKVA